MLRKTQASSRHFSCDFEEIFKPLFQTVTVQYRIVLHIILKMEDKIKENKSLFAALKIKNKMIYSSKVMTI